MRQENQENTSTSPAIIEAQQAYKGMSPDQLASEITRLQGDLAEDISSIKTLAQSALEKAWLIGHALCQAKEVLEDEGELFLPWLEERLEAWGIGQATAYRYMKLARRTGKALPDLASKNEGYKSLGIVPTPEPKEGGNGPALDLPDYWKWTDKLFDRLNSVDLDDEDVWTEDFELRAHKLYQRLKERFEAA